MSTLPARRSSHHSTEKNNIEGLKNSNNVNKTMHASAFFCMKVLSINNYAFILAKSSTGMQLLVIYEHITCEKELRPYAKKADFRKLLLGEES